MKQFHVHPGHVFFIRKFVTNELLAVADVDKNSSFIPGISLGLPSSFDLGVKAMFTEHEKDLSHDLWEAIYQNRWENTAEFNLFNCSKNPFILINQSSWQNLSKRTNTP